MTLSEIICDVLDILHPVGGEHITPENLSEYMEDEQYADEIQRVPGAVNRALADMEFKRILPGFGRNVEGRLVIREVRRVSLAYRDDVLVFEPAGDGEPEQLPDRYARLLEHFAAAELYQHDEPGLGTYYRNLYEQGCELARTRENGSERQDSVETVFGL